MKARWSIIMLMLMAAVIQASILADGKELHDLVVRAKQRRDIMAQYFMKIYEGKSDQCTVVSEPTPSDILAEDCLQGFDMG